MSKGHDISIPIIDKLKIVRETGSRVGHNDPGHVTGKDSGKGGPTTPRER